MQSLHISFLWEGDTFRKVYKRIEEIRSLVPPSVGFMALTAMAIESTRNEILIWLSMKNFAMVRRSSHKCNIAFAARGQLDIFFSATTTTGEFKASSTSMNRINIYYKKYNVVSIINRILKRSLRCEFTEPPGVPELSSYSLIDMYTKCQQVDVEEPIIKCFSDPHGKLHVIVATIAFGMGLECPNVKEIIHCGPTSTVEDYVQEIGRAGRDLSLRW